MSGTASYGLPLVHPGGQLGPQLLAGGQDQRVALCEHWHLQSQDLTTVLSSFPTFQRSPPGDDPCSPVSNWQKAGEWQPSAEFTLLSWARVHCFPSRWPSRLDRALLRPAEVERGRHFLLLASPGQPRARLLCSDQLAQRVQWVSVQ